MVISQIRSHRYTSLLLTRSFLLSKHVLGTYTFTNVSKHAFKIRMCLLRTQRHGCQIYQLRVQLGLDQGSSWSVQCYSDVCCMMSDYQGDTSSSIKATWFNSLALMIRVREFKIRMCLLRTQRHGCQIYQLRVQLGLDLGSALSVRRYSNVRCTMSDYQGDTSSNVKATQYTSLAPMFRVREIIKVKYDMLIFYQRHN